MKQIILIFIFLISHAVLAQDEVTRCLPRYHTDQLAFENWMAAHKNTGTFRLDQSILRIPVVVHVLHTGEPVGAGSNLSEQRILDQIRILNEDFRKKEGTMGYNEHPSGGDARIEFSLAQIDPAGEATNGIVRIDWSIPPVCDIERLDIFSELACYSYWDPDDYLNIWISELSPRGLSLLGLATFPQGNLPGLDMDPPQVDGVWVDSRVFGETTYEDQTFFGRTATHEIGHFLGVHHVWGYFPPGHEGDDYCELTDFCDDTPNTGSRSTSCSEKTACDGSRAMIENYMDYSDDVCMNIFTNDQIARMRTVLEFSPRRNSLLTSPGLGKITRTPKELKVHLSPNPFEATVHLKGIRNLSSENIIIHDLLGKEVPFNLRLVNHEYEILIPGNEKLLFMRIKTATVKKQLKLIRKQ